MEILPKITVITVCLNAEKTIESTLQSVIHQTYDNIEYILIDGKSKDSTVEIIEKYLDKMAITFVSEKDDGLYHAMNKAIELSSGDYLCFLNSGDIFVDDKVLEDMVPNLSHDIVYGNVIRIYKEKEILEKYNANFKVLFMLLMGKMMCHQAIFTKIEIMKKYKFNETFSITADFDFIVRCTKDKCTMKYIDRTISKVDNINGISSQKFNLERMRQEDDKSLKKNFKILYYLIRVPKACVRHISFSEYCIIYRSIIKSKPIFQTNTVCKYKALRPTLRYWYADPIVYTEKNRTYVFMEVYDEFLEKGFIGVSTFKKGRLTKPKKVISEKFHMSFPQVFKYKGICYMIPETSAINQLRIYKMGKDIYEWNLLKYYDEFTGCVDSAVYIEDIGEKEKIFIFTSRIDNKNPHMTKQKIFLLDKFSELQDISSLLGKTEWRLDVRNAGGFLFFDNKILRVAQVSTQDEYGKSIIFNNVLKINQNTYKEQFFKEITVDNIKVIRTPIITKKKGIHTYSLNHYFEVMDLNLGKVTIKKIIRIIIRIIIRKFVKFSIRIRN